MVYQRRYMRPFVGTTIVIQDDAITPGKIDEKAVGEEHLDDQAVSERTVGPSAVVSEAIKDGEVKTADLMDKSVTEPKLADGAVTIPKLSFVPSTRPLSPGVDTPEIQDGKVTLAKLAPDSVDASKIKPGAVGASELAVDAAETDKIKDDAVTQDKLATGSVGNEQIDADAVRGTEIQDGAVSENKIGADAVTTTKIKDANVTEPKLEADIIRKLLDSSQLLYDDFIGATLRPEWASSGDAGGIITRANSELSIRTNNTDDHKFRVNAGGDKFTSQGDKPNVFLRGKQSITNIHVRFGLYDDDNDYILFDFDTDVDGDWHIKSKKAGVETDSTTNIAATNAFHEFLFQVLSPTAIQFYIDGTPRGIISTNIPIVLMQPFMEVQNRSASFHTFTVDKYIFSSDQSVGVPPP